MTTTNRFNNNPPHITQPKQKSQKFRKLFKRLLIGFMILLVLLIISSVAVFAYYAKDLSTILKDRKVVESSKIYDRTGKVLLYDVHGNEKRTVIAKEEIPEVVKQAFLSAEDRDFYKHKGIKLTSIARAIFINFRQGSRAQGASTITQQFIKNSLLTNEKTVQRKVQEAVLSVELEREFNKEEILAMYLNEIPFGSNIYGIQAASQAFFGKDAKDLEAYQAAMIAALVKAPTRYSPYGSHTDELKIRQEFILDVMQDQGYINGETKQTQKQKPLAVKPIQENILAPHFVQYVREQLAKKYGEEVLEQGGLNVITSLDYNLQQKAEQALKDNLDKTLKRYDTQNGAIASIDPKTGQILAMVGSRDYFDIKNNGNVNVLITNQSPGSSIKPFVYANAFKKGYIPETILFDLKTNFGTDGKAYEPNNFNLKFNGPVSIRKALSNSLNIPAVKALYLAGVKDTLRFANDMGIKSYNDSERNANNLSIALGGADLQILDEISAYGVFANDGKRNAATPILKVSDNKGEILEEFKKDEKQILEPQIARQISDILSDNEARTPVFGPNSPLRIPGFDVAAKTGTSQDFRDALTMGYSPNLVTGVWVGRNDNKPMNQSADGSVVAAPIWNAFMKEALKDLSQHDNFVKPQPVKISKPMVGGFLEKDNLVKIDKISAKLATENTPPELVEERSFKEVHSILYYINKADPKGDYPKRPQDDPQFNAWEGPVLQWAKEHGYNQSAPTERDDIHTEANRLAVSVSGISEGQTLSSSTFSFNINATSPSGSLKQIDVYIDGNLQTSLNAPGSVTLNTPTSSGSHQLLVRAFDQSMNKGETTLNIISAYSGNSASTDTTPPTATVFTAVPIQPFGYQLNLVASDNESGVKSVQFFEVDNPTPLVSFPNSSSNTYTYSHNPSTTGPKKFFAVINNNVGLSTRTEARP